MRDPGRKKATQLDRLVCIRRADLERRRASRPCDRILHTCGHDVSSTVPRPGSRSRPRVTTVSPGGSFASFCPPEVDHEARRPRRRRDRADARRERPAARGQRRIVGVPVQPVGELERLAGFRRLLRAARRRRCCRCLPWSGHLDQLHAALAPVARGLDPGARPLLVVRSRGPGSAPKSRSRCSSPKPRGIAVLERADSSVRRIVERPPDPLAAAGVHQQAVRIVDLAAGSRRNPSRCSRRARTCWSAARCRAARSCVRGNSDACTRR